MLRFRLQATCLIVVLLCAVPASVAQTWHAAVAKEAITPPEPMWMSGYAGRTTPSQGTIHDLWAKALVIQDPAGQKLVLVTLDLVGIGRDVSTDVCQRLQTTCNLQRSQIALCTSHTHTGPVVGKNLGSMYFLDDANQRRVLEHTERITVSIVKAVQRALENLQPAKLTYGMGSAEFAVNRRTNREADVPQLRAAGELKGPVDHSVPVLAVRNMDNQLQTIVFGYACHATVLSLNQWSGDWPGFAQIEIEKRHPEAVAMFLAGCGADQNPLPRRTVELAQEYGQQTAVAVDEVLSGDMQPVTGKVQSVYEEIDLELAQLPTREQLQQDTESSNRYIASRAKNLLADWDANGSLSQTYPYPVQVWAIGDAARTVILGGEVVVDFSLRLRSELADFDTWVAAYSNDVMAYIPSVRVLKEGGYEGASSMIYYGLPTVWSENVEEHIIKTVHSLMAKLK